MCNRLKDFADRVLLEATPRITGELLLNYISTLTPRTEWHLAALRSFFIKWRALQYLGIEPSAFEVLHTWWLRGNPKSEAVLLCWPHKGTLSDRDSAELNGKDDARK
jgi:hypothetical protein